MTPAAYPNNMPAEMAFTPTITGENDSLVLDLLEKLYVPVALVRRAAADPEWAPEPLAYWLLAKSGATPADESGLARVEPDLAKLRVANVAEFSTQAPPGTYYLRVRAVNERGAGPASNEILVQR